ncbi:MAG: alpha/beta fold hydrolase [Gemmatimonadota bacterium]
MRDWMIAIGLSLSVVAPVTAQGTRPYTFRMVVGRDTVASDVVTRTPTQVDVDMVYRAGGQRWHYTMTVAPDQRVTGITSAFYRVAQGDTAPYQTAVAEFVGDSVHVKISGSVSRTETIATTPGAIPYVNPSSGMIEQLLRRARAMGGATDTVPIFAMVGGHTIPVSVTWQGADSAVLHLAGVEMRAAVGPDGSLLGLTVPAQNAHVVRLDGAHPLVLEKIDYGAPPGAPYTAEDVTVHTPGGLALTGTLTLPEARAGRVPAVVTITGSGAEDRDERIPMVRGYRPFWQIADTLARRGIATLRLDDRGVNGSSAGPEGATSADFANDIRAALAYLQTRSEIDDSRLALVGHSEGGLIAPMVAATESSLRGIVLMAGPAYTGRRIIAYQQRNAVEHAPSLTPAERKKALAQSEKETAQLASKNGWLRFFLDYDPLPTARKVRVPVLILQGETDHQVTPEQADTLAAAFRAGGDRDVTLRKFPDTDHLFLADSSGQPSGYAALPSHAVRPEVLGAIADWLTAHLGKS